MAEVTESVFIRGRVTGRVDSVGSKGSDNLCAGWVKLRGAGERRENRGHDTGKVGNQAVLVELGELAVDVNGEGRRSFSAHIVFDQAHKRIHSYSLKMMWSLDRHSQRAALLLARSLSASSSSV